MKKLFLPLMAFGLLACADMSTDPLSNVVYDETDAICDSTQAQDKDQTREGWQWGPIIKPSDAADPPEGVQNTNQYTYRHRNEVGTGQ